MDDGEFMQGMQADPNSSSIGSSTSSSSRDPERILQYYLAYLCRCLEHVPPEHVRRQQIASLVQWCHELHAMYIGRCDRVNSLESRLRLVNRTDSFVGLFQLWALDDYFPGTRTTELEYEIVGR